MTSGLDFEKLVDAVVRQITKKAENCTVERDVMLSGPSGVERQIDVVVTTSVPGLFELRSIISCKDYSRPVSVGVIDELDSVVRELGASKGAVVSRRGFTKGARRKAEQCDIALFRADGISTIGEIALDVPMVIRELRPSKLAADVHFTAAGGTTFPNSAIADAIEESHIIDDLVDQLTEAGRVLLLGPGEHRSPIDLEMSPIVVKDIHGLVHKVGSAEFSYSIEERTYYGHISDVPRAVYLHDLSKPGANVVFKADDLFDYRETFVEIDPKNVPQREDGRVDLICVHHPSTTQTIKSVQVLLNPIEDAAAPA